MTRSRLKPPARARRVPALRKSRDSSLTNAAVEALFKSADILTEGALSVDHDGSECWYGSIMITFDLLALQAACRVGESEEALEEVVRAITGSVRVRLRAHRKACQEVYRRYPDRRVGTAHFHSAFRREDHKLLLDLDLEVPIEAKSQRQIQ